MKLVFFGLPLAALLLMRDGHEIELAVLSPVPHPGRRRLRRQLPPGAIVDALFDPELTDLDEKLRACSAPLLVSWFWTRRIPEPWLRRYPAGALGVHPSLLPRHRGPNPFFWAIDAGDAVTGVTVHRLDAEYDTGAILAQASLELGDRNAWQLARALDRPSLKLLRRTVDAVASGRTPDEITQDDSQATWAPEPSGEALRVDWTWSTDRVLRRIRALSPVPGLALEIRGLRLFVTRAAATEVKLALRPGEAAVLPGPAPVVVVRTGDGAIAIERASANLGGSDDEEEDEPTELGADELAALVSGRGEVLD